MKRKITLITLAGALLRGTRPVGRWALLPALSLQLLSLSAQAQQQSKIKGRVADDNEGLPGVSITVKGTTTGISTNADGSYTLAVPDPNAVLVFSFIGYKAQEIPLNGRTSLDVILQHDPQVLDEVEVVEVGYNSVRRQDLASSIGSVKVTELQKAPVTSFEQALAGRVAGVQVSSTDGQPGDALNIVIRGNSSLNNSNAPLYVIDGFPIENPNNNAINPADIESIDVLKDASATAIYGSRGAQGVIIITTKRGKKGEPVVAYNGFVGYSEVTKRMKMMDAYEFVRLQNEINPSVAATTYFANGKTLESYRDARALDYQDEMFRKAPFQNHTLSLSGGNDLTRYSFSGSFANQDGSIVNSGFLRYQARLTLDQQVNTKLKFGINVNYADSKQYGTIPRQQTSLSAGNSETFNLVYNTLTYRPVPITGNYEELLAGFNDPDNAPLDNRVNPLISAQNEYNATFGGNLSANTYLAYNITKDLVLRSTAGVNLQRSRREIFNNTKTRSGSPTTSQGQINGVNGSINYSQVNDYSQENTLTYTKQFNKIHQLTALAVYSMQYDNSRGYGLSAKLLPNEDLGVSGLDEGTPVAVPSTSSLFALQSFAGRLNYILLDKYILTASYRSDGSSKFSPANRWAYFPSLALAWKLGDESFMKQLPLISNAKLRASYGKVGNNRVSDFAYLSSIGNNTANSGYPFGNVISSGFYETRLGNPDLKWETATSVNVGLELGFFKDRLTVETDVYSKRTDDLLLGVGLPTSTGFSSATVNVGSTQNQGLEFTVNTVNVSRPNFSWNSNFNISFNRNKLVSLASGQTNIVSNTGSGGASYPLYIARVGEPLAMFNGYIFDGIYQYSDFNKLANGTYILRDDRPMLNAAGAAAGRLNSTRPGDIKYKDLNGDNLIDAADMTIMGNPNPIHVGGFSNNFAWKGFDLNVFFQWSYGNDIFNANRYYLEGNSPVNLGFNQLATYADRWTPDNPSNLYYRVGGTNGTRAFSSRTIEDGSFLRLKTVQLGYNVPTRYTRLARLKTLRVYSSAQNLYTWTKYSGYDPEVSTKGYGLTPGYDFSPYPRAFVVTLGLNTSF